MNPLFLPDSEYRAVFERITQLCLEYLSSINELPTFPAVTGSGAEALFSNSLQEMGMGIRALDDLELVINSARVGGPRFFGYVLGSGEPIAPPLTCWPACSTRT